MQALRTAATGMAAQQLNVEVISNNIANMNTVASRSSGRSSRTCSTRTWSSAGAQSSDQGTIVPTGVQIGAGVKAGGGLPDRDPGRAHPHRQQASTWPSTAGATSRC